MWEIGLYSAFAPFGLLVLASVWQYPAVLEEVVKWGILRFRIYDLGFRIYDGVIVGLVFGLSETILFSMNAWSGGQWGQIGLRLILTVPMHALTATLIAWSMKYKVGYLGLAGAMMIHAGFNYLVLLMA